MSAFHLKLHSHTGRIENYNELILKYCAKRYAFTPPVYKARNQLAAMDYMANLNRPLAINQTTGKPMCVSTACILYESPNFKYIYKLTDNQP